MENKAIEPVDEIKIIAIPAAQKLFDPDSFKAVYKVNQVSFPHLISSIITRLSYVKRLIDDRLIMLLTLVVFLSILTTRSYFW
jgi:hypothetical protein